MLIVFLIICVALLVGGVIWNRYSYGDSDGAIVCMAFGGIFALVMLIIMSVAITKTVSIPVIEQQIAMYEEENEDIEQEVKVIIDSYIAYEEGVYGNIDIDDYSGDRLLLLTQLYPELKANTLIQTQIELHTSNAAEIKELKKDLLNTKVWAWWLYFKPVGGVNNDG